MVRPARAEPAVSSRRAPRLLVKRLTLRTSLQAHYVQRARRGAATDETLSVVGEICELTAQLAAGQTMSGARHSTAWHSIA
jgi:hypothetical protein